MFESSVHIIARQFAGRKVIVTGGAGFIGSNVCSALAEYGATVIAVDNFLEGGGASEANLEGIPVELVREDLRDANLQTICDNVDFVFNLAAYTSHSGSEMEPLLDLSINAAAQLRLILALRETAPQAVVVHASTRQVYGKPERLPVDELHIPKPPDANGVSKLAGEHYWMLEHRSRKRRVVSLRLTNCYGPRSRIRDARQSFIGQWFGAALAGLPFEVWGGDQLRDLLYVDDVTRAMILAAITHDCHGQTFNVGGAKPKPLKEVADLLVDSTNGQASYIVKPLPASFARIDIGSYYTDDTAFRSVSGWSPTVDIVEGFTRTLDWFGPRRESYLQETADGD